MFRHSVHGGSDPAQPINGTIVGRHAVAAWVRVGHHHHGSTASLLFNEHHSFVTCGPAGAAVGSVAGSLLEHNLPSPADIIVTSRVT